ncbi:uncharacterized protein SPPG_06101 [Spizellomyces punctatus DAOM BR117]|uniref:SGNH hydrolase-type esterase domain-containing protein n=1 Tax=Spizellomyces punctatus (strain DAOM BR117) TaxID=645134 RepID=A0A0L0HBT7_SPIPD|nr:uncharacterized protein SPPG_06101 [Spizellomyces punctatus DAOM BR117]KNC98396.1 hypothetical protein SPPG_06101 [Spizellomyces punctatus DAOM BR117]|eukprot:XP_016606436.1 hypothetical protein SPPG_06101 [Spizellomyces punctatus DAOM BR117]
MSRIPCITLLGDSLTQHAFPKGWGTHLQTIYTRKADILNRGLSGYNSTWCTNLLPDILGSPTVLIIMLGTNDSVLESVNPTHHVPIEIYKSNLEVIVNFAQDGGVRVLVLTPPPVIISDWKKVREAQGRECDRSLEMVGLYRRACLDIMERLGVSVLDTWQVFLGGNEYSVEALDGVFSDGVHLAEKGHEMLGRAVVEKIQTVWKDLDPDEMPLWAPLHTEIANSHQIRKSLQ